MTVSSYACQGLGRSVMNTALVILVALMYSMSLYAARDDPTGRNGTMSLHSLHSVMLKPVAGRVNAVLEDSRGGG